MWDADKASSRNARMWVKLGKLLEAHACERAEEGWPDLAIKSARMADVCFWQATGELAALSFKDIVPAPGDGM